HGDRQYTADAVDAAIERQFTHNDGVVDAPPRQGAGGRKQSKRYRQIERRSRLADVGWRQVDGDSMMGKFEPGIADGRTHPVTALSHGRIGQTDHGEVGQTKCDVYFDVYWV